MPRSWPTRPDSSQPLRRSRAWWHNYGIRLRLREALIWITRRWSKSSKNWRMCSSFQRLIESPLSKLLLDRRLKFAKNRRYCIGVIDARGRIDMQERRTFGGPLISMEDAADLHCHPY